MFNILSPSAQCPFLEQSFKCPKWFQELDRWDLHLFCNSNNQFCHQWLLVKQWYCGSICTLSEEQQHDVSWFKTPAIYYTYWNGRWAIGSTAVWDTLPDIYAVNVPLWILSGFLETVIQFRAGPRQRTTEFLWRNVSALNWAEQMTVAIGKEKSTMIVSSSEKERQWRVSFLGPVCVLEALRSLFHCSNMAGLDKRR